MLQIGDTIKCRDPEDIIETMECLKAEGYETEFVYEMDGQRGYWLEVTDYDDSHS